MADDAQHEHTFDSADAGASTTYPMQCSALRKNGFVVIKSRPCKIVEMSTSKTGKHGHAKVHLVAIDIFTGKKLEDLCPSTHNMDVPNVTRREYQLLDISDDGFLSLMGDDGDTKDDVKVPESEVGEKITRLFKEEEKDTIGRQTFELKDAIKICAVFHDWPRSYQASKGTNSNQQTQEDDDNFGTQGRRIKQKKEFEQKVSKTYHGSKALELYLQSYQLILWKQCHTLVHSIGLPPELEIVVKDLWSLQLRRIGIGNEESDLHSSQETSQPDTSDCENHEGRERLSRSKAIPKLIDSLGHCYLGMLLLRLPISLGDLHREDVPYFRAVRHVPAEMREKLPARYLAALDSQSILEPDDLRKTVHELSLFYSDPIGLTLPALNYPLLLFKHIRDLALPLDLYPAVRRTAKLMDIDFTFPQSKTRQKVSFFPEIALMALLVVLVKIYHPFDSIDRHPRTLSDPGVLAVNWDHWCKVQQEYEFRETAGGTLGHGNEVKVTEADSFKLSGHQIDEYLDWFEKSFIDEERARKHPRGYPDQLLNMFPTGRPGMSTNTRVSPAVQHQDDEEALQRKLKAVQGSLKVRGVTSDSDDATKDGDTVNRIGSFYKRYRKVEELSPAAKAFHEAAAKSVAIKLPSLLVAVQQIEHKLLSWRRKRLKADEESDRNEAASLNDM
ncbi:MAG: hypothetical protein LQ341_002715 [Variospora aurantia]|nr:MAG: hypothetical protein LQ341_002715 [Variospora aurantia]